MSNPLFIFGNDVGGFDSSVRFQLDNNFGLIGTQGVNVTSPIFGADPTGIKDSTSAIQAAVNSISTVTAGIGPGGVVYLPAGNYTISAPISLPYGVSIHGDGMRATFLNCYSCNGINLVESVENDGAQYIRDLAIVSKSGVNFSGIYANSGVYPSSENDGFYITQVDIEGFDVGINFTLAWHSYITQCIIHNVNTAILMAGNVVLCTIRDNQIIHESGGAGGSVNCGINMTSTNTESNMIFNNFIFGFATAINLITPWSTVVSDNTILTAAAAGVAQIGIQFQTAEEHLVIQNNMIESASTAGANVIGVYGQPLNSPSNSTTIIQNNRFRDDNGLGNGVGLQINGPGNTYQNRVIIQNNNFSGYSLYDCVLYNPIRMTVENNNFESTGPTYSLLISGGCYGPIFVNQNWMAKSFYAESVYAATGQIPIKNNTTNGTYAGIPIPGNAIPTTGTWAVGNIVYNTNPISGGFIGWVCTVAGSPGTWKTFGAIS